MTTPVRLILASASPYRRTLLERLQLPFTCQAAAVDETPLAGESAPDMVMRLSLAKASVIASQVQGEALVIGSDQTLCLGERTLGKPGTPERAREQLRQVRDRSVQFLTGVCVIRAGTDQRQTELVPYSVRFRNYTDAEIDHYIERDRPFDCAGSFRSEGLGISLVESMHGADPTALIGLPLVALARMLRAAGLTVP